MKKIEKILFKLAESSKNDSGKYILNNDDLINYFEAMVNNKKIMYIPRFEIEIICDEYPINNKAIIYNKNERKFILNKGLLFSRFINDNKNASTYDFNIILINFLNMIIAKIELFRMLEDNLFFKVEPLFYSYLVDEFIDDNKGTLINHYIKFRKLQLTSNIINLAHNEYNLECIRKLEFDNYANKCILESFNVKNEETPIMEAINEDVSYHYEMTNKFITNRLGEKVADNYFSALVMNDYENSNLLNCILFGKPINNINEVIDISSHMSIFEYAQDLNEINKDQLLKKLNIK